MPDETQPSARERVDLASTNDKGLRDGKPYSVHVPRPQIRSQKRSHLASAYNVQQSSTSAEVVDSASSVSDTKDEPEMSLSKNIKATVTTTTVTTTSTVPRTRLVEFFSLDVFRMVLRNPTILHRLQLFAEARFCGESLEFLEKVDEVDQYHQSLERVRKQMTDICRTYLAVESPSQINVPETIRAQVAQNVNSVLATSMTELESVFLPAQSDIEKLVASDIYPQFVRFQMSLSATRALTDGHSTYGGLGDCFCLTDVGLADNPIVFASDGFANITGYRRSEIIPRNCRFLRSDKTDPDATARVSASIGRRSEHVELLLNQRKSGEPFWNLLYTTPLYDSEGKLSFFLGGQVDVSTAIHQTSDILRILALTLGNELPSENLQKPLKSSKSRIFKRLRQPPPIPTKVHNPGLESELVGGMHEMSLNQQKRAFYSAYSKYIVLDARKHLVKFCSAGVIELLNDCSTSGEQVPVLEQDIFKVLGQCAAQSLSRDYKSLVRNAIKAGQAISLNMTLHTNSLWMSEAFATHWTPLKDAEDNVTYIVLILSKVQR